MYIVLHAVAHILSYINVYTHIGETDADKLLNAKYAISCARKIGAMVFLCAEDIAEGKSKMTFTFCAALWAAELLTVTTA